MIFHLKDDLSFVFMEQTPDPPTSDETWDHPGVRESIFASIEKHHMPSLFLKIIPHAQVAVRSLTSFSLATLTRPLLY